MPSTNPVPTRERLIVALDVPDAKRRGSSSPSWMILRSSTRSAGAVHGRRLFRITGLAGKKDKRVFVDLKFFDIPATVQAAVKQLSSMGATFCTVHGNQSIMEAAARPRVTSRCWR